MKIDISSLIYLLGVVQAIILIIAINLKEPFDSQIKKVTSLLLFTMIIVMLYYVVFLNNMDKIYTHITSLGTASWMFFVPMYYFFCCTYYNPKWKISWREIPLILIPTLFFLEGVVTNLGLQWWIYSLINDEKIYLDLWMVSFFSSGFYSLYKSIMLYFQARNERRNKVLFGFSIVYLSILVVFALGYLILRNDYVIWFETSLIICCELFVFVLIFRMFSFKPLQKVFEKRKHKNGLLSLVELTVLTEKLDNIMKEQKPFLSKDMTLGSLSTISCISSDNLSELFNSHYKSNFYDVVNSYRLKYLEELILNPANRHYKIIALAEESGFKSKTTFYKVFKEKYLMTPAEYIKKQKELTM